jgi:hypothetical protein
MYGHIPLSAASASRWTGLDQRSKSNIKTQEDREINYCKKRSLFKLVVLTKKSFLKLVLRTAEWMVLVMNIKQMPA